VKRSLQPPQSSPACGVVTEQASVPVHW
jgi:hypothetical protein